jgi:hypothetical protein
MSHAVIAFGRMNPPTVGHEKMIHAVHDHAKSVGGHAEVIASHSHDKKKNPVPQDKKMGYLKKVAPKGVKVTAASKEHPSIFHHAARLHAEGHKHLTVVSDKSEQWGKSLKANNGKKGPHGYYKFKSITMKSSGKRDPKASGTEGMSGTKMRAHAKAGDHKSFKAGLPKALHPHAHEIMKHVNEEVELEERVNFKPSPFQQRAFARQDPRELPKTKRQKMQDKLHGAALDRKLGIMKRPSRTDEETKRETQKKALKAFLSDPYNRDKQAAVHKHFPGPKPDKEKLRDALTRKEEMEQQDEALSLAMRVKKKLHMRRNRPKLKRMKRLYKSRKVPEKNLRKRSAQAAIRAVRKRVAGKKGQQYSKLTAASKQVIDKKVKQRQKIVQRLAKRMLPRARKAELMRLSKVREDVNETAYVVPGAGLTKSHPDTILHKAPGPDETKTIMKKKNAKSKIGDLPSKVTEQDLNALFLKSVKSGHDFETIIEVYIRGIESFNEERSGNASQQGFARVNSFISKGAALEEDADLLELSTKTLASYHLKSQGDALKTAKKYDKHAGTAKEDPYVDILYGKKDAHKQTKRFEGGERAERKLRKKANYGDPLRSKSVVGRSGAFDAGVHHGMKRSEMNSYEPEGEQLDEYQTRSERSKQVSAKVLGDAQPMSTNTARRTRSVRTTRMVPRHTVIRRGHAQRSLATQKRIRKKVRSGSVRRKKETIKAIKDLTPVREAAGTGMFEPNTDVVAAADRKTKKRVKLGLNPEVKMEQKKDRPSNPYMKLEGTPEAAAHARKVTPGQVNEVSVDLEHPSGAKKTTSGKLVHQNQKQGWKISKKQSTKDGQKFSDIMHNEGAEGRRVTYRQGPRPTKGQADAMQKSISNLFANPDKVPEFAKNQMRHAVPTAGEKKRAQERLAKKKVDEKYSGPVITSTNRASVEKAAADSLKGKDKIYNQPTKAVPKRKDELMPPSEKRMRRQGYTKEDTNLSFSQWLEAYGSSYGSVRAGNPGGKSSTTYKGSKDYTRIKQDPKKKLDRFGRAKTAVSWTNESFEEFLENLTSMGHGASMAPQSRVQKRSKREQKEDPLPTVSHEDWRSDHSDMQKRTEFLNRLKKKREKPDQKKDSKKDG